MNASSNDTEAAIASNGTVIQRTTGNCSSKSDGNMDDLQFNASLDALLESESLDGTAGSASFQPNSILSATMGLDSSLVTANPGQGLLAASGTVRTSTTSAESMVFSPPGLPYNVTASNQSTTPRGMESYSSNSLSSMQGSSTHGSIPLLPQSQHAIVPSAAAVSVDPTVSSRAAMAPPSGSKSNVKFSKISSISRKRHRDITAVSEDEEDRDKRRQNRNLREQQRSQKITNQIEHLRDILESANVQFKQDKYSTLVSVAEYIKDLQAKSAMLDAEQQKLITTISKTNETVNDKYVPASTTGENPPGSGLDLGSAPGQADDTEAIFVPNVDYRSVFSRCGLPLAVLSVDGRFIDCNVEFERLVGYGREELLPREKVGLIADDTTSSSTSVTPATGEAGTRTEDAKTGTTVTRNLSLFNLLSREHMEGVFLAMSEMLKHPPEKESAQQPAKKDFWSGLIFLSRNPHIQMQMNVSLVRSSHGRAKFFHCSITPLT